MASITAIVGTNSDFSEAPQFLFEDHPLAGSAPDNAQDGNAGAMQTLGDRMDHGCSHSSPDAQGAAGGNQFGWAAEWTRDARNALAGFERHQVAGAFANRLNDQRDSSGSRISVGDGQRDALGIIAKIDDDKLARFPDLRDPRSEHIEASDIWA